MTPDPETMPELARRGGDLPVSAELIERRLNEIWQEVSTGHPGEASVVRVCLANLIVVTDPANQAQAQQLASEMAAMHPSRIFLVVIDDDRPAYAAFVSTSCSRDSDTGVVRCWEIIQILTDREHTSDIPGAIRSLLVDSVPVVSIDFRPFQTTPEFDRTVQQLSDYYIVNAEVVPVGTQRRLSVSLRWYWTLPLRELLSELFSVIASSGKAVFPTEIVFCTHPNRDSYDDLMSGWILHRFRADEVISHGSEYDITYLGHTVRLKWEDVDELSERLLTIRFDAGPAAEITVQIPDDCADAVYRATYNSSRLEGRLTAYALSGYLTGILRDETEVHEYLASCEAARRLRA